MPRIDECINFCPSATSTRIKGRSPEAKNGHGGYRCNKSSVMNTLRKNTPGGIPGNLDCDADPLLKIVLADDCRFLRCPRLIRNTVEFDNRPATELDLLHRSKDGR